MKKGIDVWSDYDRGGEWMLCIGKRRGKLSLDDIRSAAAEYELDYYVLVLDCREDYPCWDTSCSVPNNDGTITDYDDLVQLYPMDNVWKDAKR